MKNDVINRLDEIVNVIYPVGSIYLSMNNVNPQSLFGGTWVQLKDRFLLGAGAEKSGTTGGSNIHSHGYRIGYRSYCQNPAGQPDAWILAYDYLNKKWSTAVGDIGVETGNCYTNSNTAGSTKTTSAVGLSVYADTTQMDGRPAYLVVYMWQRTA